MIENKGERLTTLGFGIPNLLKSGEVGYFPEQFLVELGLQGKTALEIQRYFMTTGMNFDGDVIYSRYDNTTCFVDLKHNVFIKSDNILLTYRKLLKIGISVSSDRPYFEIQFHIDSYKYAIELLTNAEVK